MPSSKIGLGNANQMLAMTLHTSTTAKSVFLKRSALFVVIPIPLRRERDLPHGAWITLSTLCDLPRVVGSFSRPRGIRMTSMLVRVVFIRDDKHFGPLSEIIPLP